MLELAILRQPCSRFASGLTTADLGSPSFPLALTQHEAYASAFRELGIEALILEPDDRYPDSCFVEDCAIVAGDVLIWTRPGAPSRRGEVDLLQSQLQLDFKFLSVTEGFVDGGDVCQIEDRFLIGLSNRTDRTGAQCLAGHLESLGFGTEFVDLSETAGLLHLKSGLSYLGNGVALVDAGLADHPALTELNKLIPSGTESYAANAVSLGGGWVLFAAGYPLLADAVREKGFEVIELEMSEFQKMDGGLSCLSLRF